MFKYVNKYQTHEVSSEMINEMMFSDRLTNNFSVLFK